MTCLCANTRRIARSLTRLYEEHLRTSGLTPPQFALLALLAERPGLAQLELAEELDLDQTTLSRNLRLMIGNQWLRRRIAQEDRRQASYSVTAAGRAVWRSALPHWKRAQRQMQRGLGSEWAATVAALDRLAHVASGAA